MVASGFNNLIGEITAGIGFDLLPTKTQHVGVEGSISYASSL